MFDHVDGKIQAARLIAPAGVAARHKACQRNLVSCLSLAVFLILCGAVSIHSNAYADDARRAALLAHFSDVVFPDSDISENLRANRNAKWLDPIIIRVLGNRNRELDLIVDAWILRLSSINNLRIKMFDKEEKDSWNVSIIFSDDFSTSVEKDYRNLVYESFPFGGPKANNWGNLIENLRHSENLCYRYTNAHEQVTSTALVLINPNLSLRQSKKCLAYSVAYVLGLLSSAELYSSAVSSKMTDYDFTVLDYIILSILYDKRIRVGLDKRQSMEIAERILSEHTTKLEKLLKN